MPVRFLDETEKPKSKVKFLDQPELPTFEMPKSENVFGGVLGLEPKKELTEESAGKIISGVARPTLEIGGAVAGNIAGGGPTPAGAVGGAVGFGAGRSAADAVDRFLGIKEPVQNIRQILGETGENLLSGAEAEALGLVMKPLASGIGKLSRVAGKKLIKTILGPSDEAISARFNRPGEIKAAMEKPVEDIAENLASGINKLSKEITDLDKKAWDTLLKLNSEPRSEIIKLLKKVRSGIGVQGSEAVGPAAKRAVRMINELIKDVMRIKEKGRPANVEHFLTQKQMRKIIQAADQNINWNLDDATVTNDALIEFRTLFNDRLRKNNPQFAEIMDPLAERMKVLHDTARSYSLGKEAGQFVPKETTPGRILLSQKEGRGVMRERLDKLKKFTGVDIEKEIGDFLIGKEFRGGRTQGSRNVNLLTALGAGAGGGVGGLFGGTGGAVVGSLSGSSAGSLAGGFIDKEGGRMAASIIDSLTKMPFKEAARLIQLPQFRRVISAAIKSSINEEPRKAFGEEVNKEKENTFSSFSELSKHLEQAKTGERVFVQGREFEVIDLPQRRDFEQLSEEDKKLLQLSKATIPESRKTIRPV